MKKTSMMTHDMTDKQTRCLLLRRYLDGDTTVEEEQSLTAYYRTVSSVDADEREAAALFLDLDAWVLPSVDEPSEEGVSEFDRLLSRHAQSVGHPASRWRVRLLAGCAAAAVAVLGYLVLKPSDAPDNLAPQSLSVAKTTTTSFSPATPSTVPVVTTATAESAIAVPSRPQPAARHHRRPVSDTSTAASENRINLASVLNIASSSDVNVGIERKGNAFLVSSTAADGMVKTYIVDVSDASDMAVYALCDTDHPTAEYGNGGEVDVHGPNL